MFIRETRNTVNGKKYTQYHLIESFRTEAGPRQRFVLNLGKLTLSKEQWKPLANAIEGKVKKKKSLFAFNPRIEKLSTHYANLIIQNKLNEEAEIQAMQKKEQQTKEGTPKESEYIPLNIHSIDHANTRTIGAEHLIVEQIKEYDLRSILSSLGYTKSQIDYAFFLIASKAIHPSSERETARWIEEQSGIKELLGIQAKVHDSGLHRMACSLYKHKDILENTLARKAKEIFSLQEKIILYDLTNTFFEGSMRKSKIATPGGKSKERRNDRPLVTLALTVDEQGFPKKSNFYPGNTGEPETLEDILDDLISKDPLLAYEKTIVIDAGIASEENLTLIKKKGFHYLAVSRKHTYPKDFWNTAFKKTLFLHDNKTTLTVALEKTPTESFLLVKSSAKEAKESAMLKKKQKKFEAELTSLHKGLSKKNTTKKYERIIERIGRIKERYGIGSLYDITITTEDEEQETKTVIKAKKKNEKTGEKTEKKVASITFKRNEKGRARIKSSGEYVIRTSRTDLEAEEISELHRSLTTIESSFKAMKSNLGLRPSYHKKDIPIQAHIFVTVLTYHILAGVQKKLREKGYHHEWTTIVNILASHTRVTTELEAQNKDIFYVRGNTKPTSKQEEIYTLLSIKKNPLRNTTLCVPCSTKNMNL